MTKDEAMAKMHAAGLDDVALAVTTVINGLAREVATANNNRGMNNRLYNCKNPYQGGYKKVLCVCSAGLLRSPTAAWVLSNEPFNFNTRACGLHDYALVPIDKVLVEWADEIVCMDDTHTDEILRKWSKTGQQVVSLSIPDVFSYRDEELVSLVIQRYMESIG